MRLVSLVRPAGGRRVDANVDILFISHPSLSPHERTGREDQEQVAAASVGQAAGAGRRRGVGRVQGVGAPHEQGRAPVQGKAWEETDVQESLLVE